MKLAIVGYGKMGRMVEQLAPEYGFESVATFDIGDDFAKAAGADAAIEFTTPEAAAGQYRATRCHETADCGGHHRLAPAHRPRACGGGKNGTALVWSPNFSVGVNVFLRVVREAAKLLAEEKEYGAWAWEIHHDTKKDAPSGTMIKLVEEMKAAGYARNIDVSSSRAGRHPERTRSASIPRPTPSRLRHAARRAKGSHEGRLKRHNGLWGSKAYSNSATFYFPRGDLCFQDAVQRW